MSQSYSWSVDSEVIDYYQDIAWSQDPYIGMDTQFDLIFEDIEPQITGIIKEPAQIRIKKEVNLNEYELISIEGKPKSIDKIKKHYNDLQEYNDNITLGKALEKGAKYVREYYNDKNLRKRIK